MLSFFRKKNIKVIPTTKGSHGDHWYVLRNEKNTEELTDQIMGCLETGVIHKINDEIKIVDVYDKMIRTVIEKDDIITGFPCLKGSNYEDVEIYEIKEWVHANSLEAIIRAKHISGCAIDFFATDYAKNKEIYKNQKKLKINFTSLVYMLIDDVSVSKYLDDFKSDSDVKIELSEEFCCFFPEDPSDDINFIARIKSIKEYSSGTIQGFILSVNITDKFNIEMFVSKDKIKKDLKINTTIGGLAWVQGTLE